MSTAVAEAVTERTMLNLLHRRYGVDQGNGPRYVCAEHVRSHAGFDARRTCDFMALDVWPSSGMPLHGVEVKTSRADWLRELKDPTKSEEFMRLCDFWWLAAPAGVAHLDELPSGWGLLEVAEVQRPQPTLFRVTGQHEPREPVTALRVARAAPRLRDKHALASLSRSFTVSLMRAAAKTARRVG